MSKDNTTNLPSQKELEKELSEYLSHKYGEQIKIISTGLQPMAARAEKSETGDDAEKKLKIDFNIKPETLIAYLDEYVIRQDEAKAVLATKICTHLNRIRYSLEHPGQAAGNMGDIKSNVLLGGSTGTGKTFLVKLIAQRLGVPFIKGDATKFSETGYVGGDVEDLVRDLVRQAGGDIERAQYGIIYVDEIDKIASSQYRLGADVSRTGVQRAFLKPMEETEVELKVPHDPISQIEAIEHYRTTGKREKRVVNTKHILFIMSGAFAGLDEIVKKRVQQQTIGFEGKISSRKDSVRYLKQVKAEDLIQFGFESEFIGRLPVIAFLDDLAEDDLYQILVNPNNSVVVGKKKDFRAYGIRILFEDEALRRIAAKAVPERTGARGLLSVMEKTMLPFEKKLPSLSVDYLVVTPEIVEQPATELRRFVVDPDVRRFHAEHYQELFLLEQERLTAFIQDKQTHYLTAQGIAVTPGRLALMSRQCLDENMDTRNVCDLFIYLIKEIREWEKRYSEAVGLRVEFSEEAVDRILAGEPRNIRSINTLCENLLKIFEYGLRLIKQKNEIKEVVIPAAGVDNPEEFINGLVGENFKI